MEPPRPRHRPGVGKILKANSRQTLLQTCLLAAALLALPPVVRAQDFTYATNNGAITIISYIGTNNIVTIPATINGLPVTNIADGALGNSGISNFSLIAINVDDANLYYSSLDGVLFDKTQSTLIQYPLGKTRNYIIPNGVTNIGRWAFAGASLTSITISGSITYIGESSPDDESGPFSGCSLTNVLISNGVTTIGDFAFDNCSSLTSVTIPDSVTSIGGWAFLLCYSLTSVTIPNSVTNIGDYAYVGCGSLTNILIGKGVTSIRDSAFLECTSLASVMIPASVTSIGDGAFQDCESLTSITIPDRVTNIGNGAYVGCETLTNVLIGNGVISVGDNAFRGYYNLTMIAVDDSNLFYSSTAGVLFNKSQTTLVEYPAAKAGSYIITNGVTDIGDAAFVDCFSLTSVTIPNSVTSIGAAAFSGCFRLAKAYFAGNAPDTDSSAFFTPNPFSEGGHLDPVTAYYLPGATGWSDFFDDTGVPTMLWLPQVQTGDASFGVQAYQFGFSITWASGQTVVVEACMNLANPVWQPVQTNTLTSDSVYFSDPQWTDYPARFYRLRSP
jgi:hypothetical protein